MELITLALPLRNGHNKRRIGEVTHCTTPILDIHSALQPIRPIETHHHPEKECVGEEITGNDWRIFTDFVGDWCKG